MRADAEVIDSMILAWLDSYGVWTSTASRFAALIWPRDPIAALDRITALERDGRLLLARRWICARKGTSEQDRRSRAAEAITPPMRTFERVFKEHTP